MICPKPWCVTIDLTKDVFVPVHKADWWYVRCWGMAFVE